MGDDVDPTPPGWVRWSKSSQMNYIATLILMGLCTLGLMKFLSEDMAPTATKIILSILSIMLIVLAIINFLNKRYLTGAFVRQYPVVHMAEVEENSWDLLVKEFEAMAEGFGMVRSRPTSVIGFTNLPEHFYSDPANPDDFINLEFQGPLMVEVGVSRISARHIQMIEDFFKENRGQGSKWIEPEYSRNMHLTASALLCLVLVFVDLLLFFSPYDGWIFGLVLLPLVIFMLSFLYLYDKRNWYLIGGAYKRIVMDEGDLVEVLSRASTEMRSSLEQIKDRSVPGRTSYGDIVLRFLSAYRVGSTGISIVLSRGTLRGVDQGFIAVILEDSFKLDDLLVRKFEQAIDEILMRDLIGTRTGFFFEREMPILNKSVGK